MKKSVIIFFILILLFTVSKGQRIKDIAYIGNSTSVQIFGYGLVVGLARTGDSQSSAFTIQSIGSMLKKFGITVPERDIRIRNVAAVMVTATVSSYLKPGAKFDVTVSSVGDARSLLGGTLLLTPLTTIEGKNIIGFSQGALSVGGYDYSTRTGSSVAKNHVLTGRVPQGGLVREAIDNKTADTSGLKLYLKEPDLTTINNIVNAINLKFSGDIAKAADASEISLKVPADYSNDIVKFMAELEVIQVESDFPAKVVLNERTGTVVAGAAVHIKPITISHGGMNIVIRNYPIISQPGAFSNGNTVVMDNILPYVTEDTSKVIALNGATTVQEVANALNSLKVTPQDIIAIFQAIKEAGALVGELVIL